MPGDGAALSDSATEVLVIGAGPSGLTAALCLALHGVPFRLLDRKERPSGNSRAAGIQSRSLEVFEQLGLVDAFLQRGRKATGVDIHTPSGRVRAELFGEGVFPSRYPHVLLLEQSITEALLRERLAALGHEVEWDRELVSLALDGQSGGARARVRGGDGREQVLGARWVIGADGADSTVREAVGVELTGSTYEQRYVVADVRVSGHDLDLGYVHLDFNRTGFVLLVPLTDEGVFRMASNYPPGFGAAGEDPSFEDVRDHVRRVFPGGLDIDDPRWFGTFRFHSLCAERFHRGPVFLVGDSAHVHSPVGGQGMNTGIQDAHALVWRLALARRGALPAKALDTYETERLPVARGIVRTTDAVFRLVDHPGGLTRWLRTRVLPRAIAAALRVPPLRRGLARRVAQVAIRYRQGMLVPGGDGPRGMPRPGERFPYLEFRRDGETRSTPDLLDYRSHHLLVVDGPDAVEATLEAARALEDRFADTVACHSVLLGEEAGGGAWSCSPPAGVSLRGDARGCCLVRPDGHVALTSPSVEAAVLAGRIAGYLGGEGWAPT